MEKVLGPIDGYYVAIFARELDGKFRASYKVCVTAPSSYGIASPLRHGRVGAPSGTLDDAMDVAEQLARLHIARMQVRVQPGARPAAAIDGVDFDTSIGGQTPVQGPAHLYAPTQPAPL